MNPQQLKHVLRITIAGVSAIFCLLLVASWARSYEYFDWWGPGITLASVGDKLQPRSGYVFESARGVLSVWYAGNLGESAWWAWSFGSSPSNRSFLVTGDAGESALDGFRARTYANGSFRGSAPHWSLALLFAIIATCVWTRPSFSLRTLLIGITLLALLLGLAAYANGS